MSKAYRELSISHFLGNLGCSKINLLIIGRESSWILNACSPHKQFFIGTRQSVGLTEKAENINNWQKLATMVLRYAALGSQVKVYCLHPKKGEPRFISEFKK